MEVLQFPFVNMPYDELRKYIKIEFGMRYRYLNDDGSYGGYYHRFISSAKQCAKEDFKGVTITNPEIYICPDWDEDGEFYLMNNANAAWYMSEEAT